MIERLPKSLKELNYKTWVAIINKIPTDKPEGMDEIDWSRLVNLTSLSIMLGVIPNEIEQLRATKVTELIRAISYLDIEPRPEKTRFKVKQINEITYDEFVTYQKLRLDQWNNLEAIFLLLVKDVTKEDIINLSAYDAIQIFFCLNKSTQKFLKRLKYSTMLKLINQTPKLIVSKMLSRK